MDFGTKLIQITNYSTTFKGLAVAVAGLAGLGFWYYMKTKWNEPESFGFKVFHWFSVFVIFFGLYVLLFRPGWWKLPY